jgi:PAS domain S-box-containing protein
MATFGPMGGDVERALENIRVPSYVIDTAGVIRWVNPAAREVAGDVVGMQFTSVVAPEEVRRSRETFARKIAGTAQATDHEVVIVNGDGERLSVDICSVPLYDGHRIVGVFGQVVHQAAAPAPAHPSLTPRQSEILRLLEHGHSTRQIASELHLSLDTVRNHIRFLLRALGAHSRLEAVAMARKAHPQTA